MPTEATPSRPAGRRQRGRARQLATDWLATRIQSGAFQPGQRIPPEPELCALLGVGRSSVREAVQGLVAAGVLEIRPGTGTFVRPLGAGAAVSPAELSRLLAPAGVLDLLELRAILEASIVELATERATPEDLAAVERVLDAGATSVHDPNLFADFLQEYHLGLAAAAHNAALVQLTAALNDLFRHRRVSMGTSPETNQRSFEQHRQVVAAIRARQLATARSAVRSIAEDDRRTVVLEARTILRRAGGRGS
jgi:GntR family transcriptional repressor for pyruvate dehydrogenase complex